MNKTELVNAVADSADITKTQAERAVGCVLASIQESLTRGEEVQLPNLGKFVIGERAARTGRNPQTGETIQIAASRTVQFKASAPLKRAIND
ncbi:hypothetical protein CAI21_20865 [Alkalilimnicola ehrlichii]|uniref:DNA-binding protein HU n=1 Tax=Alkalilimnicola ehrlichii TaxID=351052 RepID=A0A3E0WP43_9GAMM|nr:HU family DNA-binding protein [Alkalilimnicola ehrlichii]RFA24667.1 hypothetical protein CAI21_20865 [Alkalilimnicola ehrlichii]RFA33756.1 hypothetical protein CAL65_16555 [Alkalilimnicola ehrlichii]